MTRLIFLFISCMLGLYSFLSAQHTLNGTWKYVSDDGSYFEIKEYSPQGVGRFTTPSGSDLFVYKNEPDGRLIFDTESGEGWCGNHIKTDPDFYQVGPNYEMFHYLYQGPHNISEADIQRVRTQMADKLNEYANSIIMTSDGLECYLQSK
ncbi:MAG: hypothetical protein AAF587_04710 [Bacteroidota bacterium]